MKIIKRSGREVTFDSQKIEKAITAANNSVEKQSRLPKTQIQAITKEVVQSCLRFNRQISVEDIQDMVENALIRHNAAEVAKSYIRYRRDRELVRKANTTDEQILALIDDANEDMKQENSNKNPTLASTQRDYMAGAVSRDLTERLLLPKDIVEAHKQGIIHFHDSDFFAQHIHNCCLINLEDMLQNGTVISETKIEKPHSFSTACNITTQIIAQVACSQYGGCTFSLAHLAPFIDVSRQNIIKDLKEEVNMDCSIQLSDRAFDKIVEKRVRKEINRGIQMLQYQILTLLTTNGQAPFVSMFMYLNEAKSEQEKSDLALAIEEVLKQRIQGVKNEQGIWITPAFPKLLYVLEDDNIHPGTQYWSLTQLAAKCTAKRMVPDYISEKIMLRDKISPKSGSGEVYGCMGCVDGREVITYRYNKIIYTESFERMWNRLRRYFVAKIQPNGLDYYMETPGVDIYDQKEGFVRNYGLIKNHTRNWLRLTFSNGRTIMCTPNHPFETEDKKILYASDLKETDNIPFDKTTNIIVEQPCTVNTDRAWLYGFSLCDSTYCDNFIASIAVTGEEEIEKSFVDVIKSEYGLCVDVILRNRGERGCYKDLFVRSDKSNTLCNLRVELLGLFEGKVKETRHVPNEVFSWSQESKLAFLAGMIDADGYLNTTSKKAVIQIGSTNKELAIQQALLAQSCGMFARIYLNYYRSNRKNKIRYRVEFTPSTSLLSYIRCYKKKNMHNSVLYNSNTSNITEDTIHIIKSESIVEDGYSYDVTTASEHFTVSGIYSHNCRSFLTPDRTTSNLANALNYDPNHGKYYGRFNQGVVTINLPDVALSAQSIAQTGCKDILHEFWSLLSERLELCHRALRCRHERLLGTHSDIAPLLWQYGALARLPKGTTIDKLLYDGYSTLSLGYAGLWECVYGLIGKKLTEPEGKELGLKIMEKLNEYTAKWKAAENIDYSLYGTPLESTTYKFAKCLKKRFGVVPGVSDKNYITNSYHIHVTEPIDAFDKLALESEFQVLSPGGAISYIEVPNMQQNLDAVLAVIQFIYEHIMYAELNTKSDYCQVCGYNGEIQIVERDKKLIWQCPHCGNTDQSKMNVARRTCGYIGTQFWNQGRTQEIKDRVLHL